MGLDPKRTLESYPHELSGGQRQRVPIAVALTRDPKLIIADELTPPRDVTVQKQVIALLNELREKLGFAMIFVSHDLALVAEVAHHITVMYAGQAIEQAPTKGTAHAPDPRVHAPAGRGPVHRVRLATVSGPRNGASPRDFRSATVLPPGPAPPITGPNIRPVLTEVGPEHVYAALLSGEGRFSWRSEIIIEEGQEEQR